MALTVSIAETRSNARRRLLAERNAAGHWTGELSSSALSTATATAALTLAARAGAPNAARLRSLARSGRAWLAKNRGADGGFGDTIDSPSNLSTTALGWMALGLEPFEDEQQREAHAGTEAWLQHALPGLGSEDLAQGLADVYGADRTFAVPILVACAAGGCFSAEGERAWSAIPALPFELAALPRGLFKWLGLPVVSYALPALIAIGQAIHSQGRGGNPLTRALRNATREKTLRVLTSIQPEGGGFLEATPLTSFVVMSLIACGRAEHEVVRRGLEFLERSIRRDGSWPIDTDLATWGTTLAINALACDGRLDEHVEEEGRRRVLEWLLAQRYQTVHPYTGAAPGGWAWTDKPGGVPDADDTPGALLALHALAPEEPAVRAAAHDGLRWLCDLANRDGGMPTFCRGWGTLPFDQSCPDLTAHALRAWHTWAPAVTGSSARIARARARAVRYLVRSQREDGAWLPLWFGNQAAPDQSNPLYGTSRVLRACASWDDPDWRTAVTRGIDWLVSAQNADGGFGGARDVESSIEETALGLEALADVTHAGARSSAELLPAMARAAGWLATATDGGRSFPTRPIGLYFAKLWYSERLYPLVFSVSALERCRSLLDER